MTDNEVERVRTLGGGAVEKEDGDDGIEGPNEDPSNFLSAVRHRELELSVQPKMMRLNPGERLGWWSAKKFDRRIRMRALVKGAIDDARTRILLDTGANVSVISDLFAKKLRLREVVDHGRSLDVQGISKGKISTNRRALVKITLGWEIVYEFEMWIMPHSAGVDVVLGTDFMIPAGIRLDLFHGAAKLPDEVMIPLIKTRHMIDEKEYGTHVTASPTTDLDVPGHEWMDFRLQRKQPSLETHEFWVRRTEKLIPTVTRFRRGQPDRVRVVNVTDKLVSCPAHTPFGLWVPIGDLPRSDGYVRPKSKKYSDWQVLAYEECKDRDVFKRECQFYQQWLASQPSPVERINYRLPRGIKTRPSEYSEDRQTARAASMARWDKILGDTEVITSASVEVPTEPKTSIEESVDRVTILEAPVNVVGVLPSPQVQHGQNDDGLSVACMRSSVSCISKPSGMVRNEANGPPKPRSDSDLDTDAAIEVLDNTYMSVARVLNTEGNEPSMDIPADYYEHPANEIGLEDYAKELAFLPDLIEDSSTTIDYAATNVMNPRLTAEQQGRLIAVLKKHEDIMIASDNALRVVTNAIWFKECTNDLSAHD